MFLCCADVKISFPRRLACLLGEDKRITRIGQIFEQLNVVKDTTQIRKANLMNKEGPLFRVFFERSTPPIYIVFLFPESFMHCLDARLTFYGRWREQESYNQHRNAG